MVGKEKKTLVGYHHVYADHWFLFLPQHALCTYIVANHSLEIFTDRWTLQLIFKHRNTNMLMQYYRLGILYPHYHFTVMVYKDTEPYLTICTKKQFQQCAIWLFFSTKDMWNYPTNFA